MTATRNQLLEIEKLLNKAQGLLKTVIDSQPKPTPGKPPQPYWTQKVALEIWNAWDKLKAKGKFDAREAQKIATSDDDPRHLRIDTSYSAILSRWAREGHIERVEEGA